MKVGRFLFALITVITVFCSQALADDYWPRSYFIEAGSSFAYARGDFSSSVVRATDTLGNKVSIHPPSLKTMLYPDITIGTNIWAFTLAANFHYWNGQPKLTKYEEDDKKIDSRMWRFGFEFTYNLFYPEDFQLGLGGGYSYAKVTSTKSAVFSDDVSTAALMGSGLAFVANFRYYFTEYLAVVPSIKIYENWFKNANTTKSGLVDIKPYLWETFFFISASIQYQF